jgi:hypothetical protein
MFWMLSIPFNEESQSNCGWWQKAGVAPWFDTGQPLGHISYIIFYTDCFFVLS